MRATGSPARTVSPWDTVTSRTWTYATWTSVGSPSTSCWNRMALERPEPRTPGGVDSGLIWMPEYDSVEGCQQRLAPAVPILVAGSVSRVQRCQVAVRSAVPPHHDAVGGERVGDVVLRAERVFGALEPCRDGRMDRDRFDRVGLRGGWRGRRAQGQRQEYGRDSDGVECFPVHRLQYGNRRHRGSQEETTIHGGIQGPCGAGGASGARQRLRLRLALGGRPRRTGASVSFSGQPSFERSGAVSGSNPRAVELSFSFIGFPHADDPARIFAGRPDEYRPSRRSENTKHSCLVSAVAAKEPHEYAPENISR